MTRGARSRQRSGMTPVEHVRRLDQVIVHTDHDQVAGCTVSSMVSHVVSLSNAITVANHRSVG
jgi:hypothetical protein